MNSTATDRRVGLVWFPKGSNLAASKRHQVATPEREEGEGQKLRAKGENKRIGQLVQETSNYMRGFAK